MQTTDCDTPISIACPTSPIDADDRQWEIVDGYLEVVTGAELLLREAAEKAAFREKIQSISFIGAPSVRASRCDTCPLRGRC